MYRATCHPITQRTIWAVALAILATLAGPLVLAQEFMQWSGSFGPIALPPIATQAGISTGSSTATLQLSGDAEISADNSAAALLSGPDGDTLITEYKLAFDGDGQHATGGPSADYTPYDSFLVPPVRITHAPGDDEVAVTLYVQARNPAGKAANAGGYSARATLTVTWIGP